MLSEGHPDEAERMESIEDAMRRCQDTEDDNWIAGMPENGPNLNAEPREIFRLNVSDLTPREFYERFISRGLPVVLEGLDRTDGVGWTTRFEALLKARREDLIQRLGPNCDEKPCHDMAIETTYRPPMPLLDPFMLPQVMNFSKALPKFDSGSGRFWGPPHMFSGLEGQTFADPVHLDFGCSPSLSVQWSGIKRWNLWSPVDLETEEGEEIKALTLFETTVYPRQALVKPPAWFHNTTILDGGGLSIATAYSWLQPPPYGRIDPRVWKNNPFGFETCAMGLGDDEYREYPTGWLSHAKMWDDLMVKHDAKEKEVSRAKSEL